VPRVGVTRMNGAQESIHGTRRRKAACCFARGLYKVQWQQNGDDALHASTGYVPSPAHENLYFGCVDE